MWPRGSFIFMPFPLKRKGTLVSRKSKAEEGLEKFYALQNKTNKLIVYEKIIHRNISIKSFYSRIVDKKEDEPYNWY